MAELEQGMISPTDSPPLGGDAPSTETGTAQEATTPPAQPDIAAAVATAVSSAMAPLLQAQAQQTAFMQTLVQEVVASKQSGATETVDDIVTRLANEYDADENTLRAMAVLLEQKVASQVGQFTQGLGGVYTGDITGYLAKQGITGVTPADVEAIFKDRGVTPQKWAQSTPKQQEEFLQWSVYAAAGKKALSGQHTAPPVPTRTPGPAGSAVETGQKLGGTAGDPAFEEAVQATMKQWRTDRKTAEEMVTAASKSRGGER